MQILGAYPGVEILIPYSDVRVNLANGPRSSAAGMGDITIAPFLQWSSPNKQAGSFSTRVAIQFVAPTGSHSAANPVNSGYGGWQISPYVAMSWRMTDRWEVSSRVIYDWADKVSMAASPGGPMYLAQAGRFAVLNTSISYALTPTARLGIGSYVLRQITQSNVNNSALPHSRQSVDAMGPVAGLSQGHVSAFLAAYREFSGINRLAGYSVNFRLQYHF